VRRGGTISRSGVYGGGADLLPLMNLFDKQVQLRMVGGAGDVQEVLEEAGRRREGAARAAALRVSARPTGGGPPGRSETAAVSETPAIDLKRRPRRGDWGLAARGRRRPAEPGSQCERDPSGPDTLVGQEHPSFDQHALTSLCRGRPGLTQSAQADGLSIRNGAAGSSPRFAVSTLWA
jgi:hypothetical protein